ncbi:hypothetical protein [Streptomyces apocyni]|uniref:hypothetical protein n=1 Tax=Streptomyces apocyni TaxID=2654677 RepID=UPI001E3FFCA6|nr:hypothetical protein [Streptomyces apocyni]
MTGSALPRKRRFRKAAGTTPCDGVRDGERGRQASLEPADDAHGGNSSTTKPGRLATAKDGVRKGVRRGGLSAKAGLGQIADRIMDLAPRVPVRDLSTLRQQFPGLGPEQIADRLVAGACHASSTVGAGVGVAAALPVPPAMPAELAAEITGVAAIELKLIAELREVYGLRPEGTLAQRSTAYLTSWTHERGIDVAKTASIGAALGTHTKRELRQQVMKRTVRNLPNLMPFLVGAVVGALMNRRDTKKLAERIRADLRQAQVPWDALPELAPLEPPADSPQESQGSHDSQDSRDSRQDPQQPTEGP